MLCYWPAHGLVGIYHEYIVDCFFYSSEICYRDNSTSCQTNGWSFTHGTKCYWWTLWKWSKKMLICIHLVLDVINGKDLIIFEHIYLLLPVINFSSWSVKRNLINILKSLFLYTDTAMNHHFAIQVLEEISFIL